VPSAPITYIFILPPLAPGASIEPSCRHEQQTTGRLIQPQQGRNPATALTSGGPRIPERELRPPRAVANRNVVRMSGPWQRFAHEITNCAASGHPWRFSMPARVNRKPARRPLRVAADGTRRRDEPRCWRRPPSSSTKPDALADGSNACARGEVDADGPHSPPRLGVGSDIPDTREIPPAGCRKVHAKALSPTPSSSNANWLTSRGIPRSRCAGSPRRRLKKLRLVARLSL
jgi:hypothetical protein